MTKADATTLSLDELDRIAAGADAEPQDAYMYFSIGSAKTPGEPDASATTVTKIPGVHKVTDVTLKRG